MDYDVLVIGSGIGGMESSLKLGDMGYKVLLVEKEASVGGRMILLSKVFPTLDCASCISGPKMSSTINHPNITTMAYSEVLGIKRGTQGRFTATVKNHARFVDWDACTGCQDCERACTVAVPDQFNADLAARRAAYIAFPQAVPKKAVLDRVGTSPCTGECPAGIKAHGYVSLVRSGKHEEAFKLVLDATPLVGTLGRACYAPCESECTRTKLEGAVPIRLIKRFAADKHYENAGDGPAIEVEEPNGKSVVIVGSGPAGLTAAWQLARKGYAVKILEKRSAPGGFLRHAIPVYRLPHEVVDADIANLTSLGVEIECDSAVDDLVALKGQGYDAVIVATGTQVASRMGVPGEDAEGSVNGLDFLNDVANDNAPDLAGKRVVIVGGGNVAMDAARVSLRLGAAEARVVYRRGRSEMPAHHVESDDAEAEGAVFELLVSPTEVVTADGKVTGIKLQKMQLGAPDASGRRSPEPVTGSDYVRDCDVIISTIGMSPEPALYADVAGTGRSDRIQVDPHTLQSEVPYLFAAGDVTTGATDITTAIGAGRRAAHMVDRWLNEQPLTGFTALDDRLATVDHDTVLRRQAAYGHRNPIKAEVSLVKNPTDFSEIEAALTDDEAHAGAGSCLDCGVCSECNQCVEACPADCIDFTQRDKIQELEVGAVVVSTGHKLFAADLKPEYGFGTYANVITGMQMDRLLAPTRPYNTILRPSDGKVPDRIAYVSCTGSRDKQVGNELCSKFCCMYSIKQNQLIMGSLPLADVSMHYMDMRAAGKRYDEFYQQAKDMGAEYIKGRVSKITEQENGDLVLRYEDIENGGGIVDREYDLVVLAVGIQPNRDVEKLFVDADLGLDEYHYVAEPSEPLDPGRTDIPGVFVAGTAAGAKDIVDTILHAGAAVAQVAAHLSEHATAGEEVLA
ncbi:MAG: FAD-dependent oxidoreductase [Nocardioidaceae bacterium]|nr:FAD-dependent oxidoreductase [Nocardioidaceae bacterium]